MGFERRRGQPIDISSMSCGGRFWARWRKLLGFVGDFYRESRSMGRFYFALFLAYLLLSPLGSQGEGGTRPNVFDYCLSVFAVCGPLSLFIDFYKLIFFICALVSWLVAHCVSTARILLFACFPTRVRPPGPVRANVPSLLSPSREPMAATWLELPKLLVLAILRPLAR